VVDESGVFPCRYNSAMVIHDHISPGVGDRSSETKSYSIDVITIINFEVAFMRVLYTNNFSRGNLNGGEHLGGLCVDDIILKIILKKFGRMLWTG
jgi:hypothetical protein